MRIDPNLSVVPVSSESPKSQTARSAPTGTSSQASVVALSTAGAAVAAPEDAASAAQTMKIEKLRAAVATGTYKVDYETLASRIVDDEVMRS